MQFSLYPFGGSMVGTLYKFQMRASLLLYYCLSDGASTKWTHHCYGEWRKSSHLVLSCDGCVNKKIYRIRGYYHCPLPTAQYPDMNYVFLWILNKFYVRNFSVKNSFVCFWRIWTGSAHAPRLVSYFSCRLYLLCSTAGNPLEGPNQNWCSILNVCSS